MDHSITLILCVFIIENYFLIQFNWVIELLHLFIGDCPLSLIDDGISDQFFSRRIPLMTKEVPSSANAIQQ